MPDPLENLTLRERKYIANRVKGMSKREAAMVAGYSRHMASAAVAKVERPAVREAFAKLLRQYVPAHRIAKRISEGLDAMETKFFQKDGQITDQVDVINFSERRAYAELASKMGGYMVAEENAPTNVGIVVRVEQIGRTSSSPATEAS